MFTLALAGIGSPNRSKSMDRNPSPKISIRLSIRIVVITSACVAMLAGGNTYAASERLRTALNNATAVVRSHVWAADSA